EPGGAPHRIPLEPLPFQIGRCMTAHYVIYSRQVSKAHSAIFRGNDGYHIRDLGSTNGTFVNGQRIVEAPLESGDIVHVAHAEFRFVAGKVAPVGDDSLPLTESCPKPPPASVIEGSRHLYELLAQQQVTSLFQPIVRLHDREVIGYEALGRGT